MRKKRDEIHFSSIIEMVLINHRKICLKFKIYSSLLTNDTSNLNNQRFLDTIVYRDIKGVILWNTIQ